MDMNTEIEDRLDVTLPRVELACTHRSDGSIVLANRQQLAPFSRCVGDWLEHWADTAPDTAFLCERAGHGEWKVLTYSQARESVWAIAESLLMRGLSPERPVAALSSNSIDMGLMMLGAMHAGIPFAPISTAYATVARDYSKLKHVFGLLQPGVLFVSDVQTYAPALRAAGLDGFEWVSASRSDGATDLRDFCSTKPTQRAHQAFAAIRGDTVGKILFTSGSTGMPKGVMNTQRMMCSSQQALAQLMPFCAETPPVVVDWLPWNHTAGCNSSFNRVLRHGGTLYIDDGRPVAGEFEKTVENLSSVAITSHTNVPRGFELLLAEFERNPGFRRHFFANLEHMTFAGAAMPSHHYQRLREIAHEERGNRILFSSGYGATETAPAVTLVYFPNTTQANIGLPVPGTQVKLLPNGGKLELRVRGPNVMPGYWRQPELTDGAFDDEGYYCIGDAAKFLDPDRPEAGLLFDGRVSEDFKLSSATWVNVASLRANAVSTGRPLIADAVVTGHDRDAIGLLFVLNEAEVRKAYQLPATAKLSDMAADERVRAFLGDVLRTLQREATGSSNRPTRAVVLDPAPSLENGELTDKGSVSQRIVLANRKSQVDGLYADLAAMIVAKP
jgi:feruloyl-CoA synthase